MAVGTLKVKLVAYFLVLSVLPIGAAFWGFTQVAGQSATHRVDARLQTGMRALLASYQERLDAAQQEATSIAESPAFQRDLQRRDVPSLAELVRGRTGVSVTSVDGFIVGRPPTFAATRRATVVSRTGLLGYVTVSVPYDQRLVSELRGRSGLAASDSLVILRNNRIVASSPVLAGRLAAPTGQMKSVPIGKQRFRTLVAPAAAENAGVEFAVLSPQSRIDAANARFRDRILLGLIASLALVALVAYLEGRAIVRTLRGLAEAAHAIARGNLSERVPVRGGDEFALLGTAFNEMANQLEERLVELETERARLRGAVMRFGEALAATHDPHQLLRVIVEAAVEATGANGARLLADDGTVVEAGDPDSGDERLELGLTAARTVFGTLTIVGRSFDPEQRLAAASLASHAAIALENARMHRVVERQALVDGLTGIANRRQCEDALSAEIARAERLETPLTLVLADLDDFKAVNDVHGHVIGDDVLRRFGGVLHSTVRESDVAGRWGGEEFLLLLPGADALGGVQLAERVRQAFAERSIGALVPVTCSFGVAQHRPGDKARDLFSAADQALYRAKRAGKNRVELEAPIRSF